MALSDALARIEAARGARASDPAVRDSIFSSFRSMGAQAEPPSPVERAFAYVFEKAPILRDVLMHFAKLGSTVANVAEAGVLGVQGRGDEAIGSLGRAGRQFADFVTNTLGAPAEAVGRLFGAEDVVPNLSKPTDFRSFRDVLQTAGVGELGSVNLPLLGRVTGRGTLGLGLDIASDPLTFTGVGAATKGLVGPKLARNLLEPGETLLGAQARAGERSLLSFAGKPLVRGAPVLDTFEKVVDVLKNHPRSPFRAFAMYSKPEMRKAALVGQMGRGLAERGVREGAPEIATRIEGRTPIHAAGTTERLTTEIERLAKERGVPEATIAEEVLAAKEQLPVPRHAKEARREDIWAQAKRAEKKGQWKRAEKLMREHAGGALDVERVPHPPRLEAMFPRAGDVVDGRMVREDIPNLNSISATFDDASELPGVREVPMSAFPSTTYRPYSVGEDARTRSLAAAIKDSGEINPLIVAIDKDGPYILEGGHRFDALKLLGAKSFPALVVFESDILEPAARGQLRTLMARYVSEGYTKSEAYRAATTVLLKGVPEEIAPLAASADRVLRGMLQDENIRGVTVEALSDPYKSYITTAFSDEFKDWLRKNGKDPMRGEPAFRRWSAKHPSTMKRDVVFEGRPLREIEDEMRKHFPEYAGRIFETDPRAIVGRIRAQRLGRGVGTADYVDVVARNIARPATPELIEAGWVRLGDIAQKSGKVLDKDRGILSRLGLRPEREAFRGGEKVPTQLKGVENLAVPPEIAAEMLKAFRISESTPPNILLSLFDGFTRGFKTGVTVLFPSFHVRNAVGNFWNNFVGGVWNPKEYADAGRILADAKFTGGGAVWDVGGGRSMTSKQILDHLDAGGALGYSGQLSEEELLKGMAGLPLVKQARTAGAAVESNAKIAHFLDKMRKGATPEDAILSIKKYLFDYSELSPIEKQFFRRVIPFYTFQRKNWPLILESMVTQPGKMATAAHFDAAMRARADGGGPIETTVVPGYMARRLLKLDEDRDGMLSVVSNFGLPFEDIAFMDRPFEEMAGMLNPLIKGPLQALAGKDFFRDMPLDRAEYAPGFLRWAKHLPGVGQPFLDAIGFREVKPDVYRANPRFLNWLWTFGASFSRGAGLLDTAGQQGTQAALLKYVSPVRTREYSPEEQMRQNYRRIVEGYVARLEEMQRQGVTGRAEDFYVRRDILPASPEAQEAKRLSRELGVFKSLLGRMSAAERAQARQEGLRSGGR